MDNVVILPMRGPLAEAAELAEMRAYWLAVRDDRDAMGRITELAERVADILDQVKIKGEDRQSLLWHLSLIRELAVDRKGGIEPLCKFPRFDRDPDPGAA